MPVGVPKVKLTPEQKEKIVFLHNQGVSIKEIAAEIGVNGQQVAGFVRTGIQFGKNNLNPGVQAPQNINPSPSPSLETPMTEASAAPAPQPEYQAPPPTPTLPPRPAYQAPPIQDGFSNWHESTDYVRGFTDPARQLRYQVSRVEPIAEAGVVGSHTGAFTDIDLCNMYGSGVYEVKRFEPMRATPIVTQVRVGPAFGPPRSPKFGVAAATAQDFRGNRPQFNRPPRQWEAAEDDPQRPPYYERPSFERNLDHYARHPQSAPASADGGVTAEAIRQLGDANRRALEQAENARKGGPEAYVTDFFKEQQKTLMQRMEEDRAAQDGRRREDDQRWERRQTEAQTEHQRRQDEEEKKHQRDLERIRTESTARAAAAAEERKSLLDLEEKKLALIREEAKIHQNMLIEQLKQSREDSKDMVVRTEKKILESQQATSEQMTAAQESIKEELEREREALKREHAIREKALDKEHELSKQILDIKQEALANQGGDQIFGLLTTLVKEASKSLEKVVDLQRIQSMTPDAQLADVSRAKPSIDGNVPVEPRRQAAAAAQPEPAANGNGNGHGAGNDNGSGNGHAAEPTATEGESGRMEQIIGALVEQPVFTQVLKEWGRQVKAEASPSSFANMFYEWMEDPQDPESRKACKVFTNFIRTRKWSEVLAVIGPKLSREVMDTFKGAYASDFYTVFRDVVCESQDAAVENFMAQRAAERAARRAAGAPAPAPEPAPASRVEVEAEAEAETGATEEPEAEAEVEEVKVEAPKPIPQRHNRK